MSDPPADLHYDSGVLRNKLGITDSTTWTRIERIAVEARATELAVSHVAQGHRPVRLRPPVFRPPSSLPRPLHLGRHPANLGHRKGRARRPSHSLRHGRSSSSPPSVSGPASRPPASQLTPATRASVSSPATSTKSPHGADRHLTSNTGTVLIAGHVDNARQGAGALQICTELSRAPPPASRPETRP